MRTALVTVALLLPTISAAQQEIKHERLSIAATNDEWTPTSIEVARGDVILVLATGRIRIGQVSGEVGPNGNSSGSGVLQIKIGVGAGQRAGEKAFVIADQSGPVKLRVVDSRYSDNAGAFEVSVIHIPASMIPMPSQEGTEESGTEQAYLAAMKSDLRNLIIAEEAYFADSVKYTSSLRAMHFQTSTGVSIAVVLTSDGHYATARHARAPGWTCGVFVGSVSGHAQVQKEGIPACWQVP
jgi:hypothetical protein